MSNDGYGVFQITCTFCDVSHNMRVVKNDMFQYVFNLPRHVFVLSCLKSDDLLLSLIIHKFVFRIKQLNGVFQNRNTFLFQNIIMDHSGTVVFFIAMC